MTSALGHLRVMELADDSGAYAGKLLAELGADVWRIQLPPARRPRNFSVDPDPVVQGFLHRSKRSLELPEDPAAAAAILEDLIARSDVVLEAGPRDLLAQLGVPEDHAVLSRPDLIRTRISPGGLDAEAGDEPISDLTASASAGFLALGGWPQAAPTRAYGDQSWRMASLHGAAGALLAILDRERNGLGQQVDVSIQESVATALENSLQFWDLENIVRRRTGPGYEEAGSGVYACADGFLYVMVGRLSTAQGWVNLLDWLQEAGVPGAEALRDPAWADLAHRRTLEAQALFRQVFERFAADRTKSELYVEAQQRGIAICPINTAHDLLANAQLAARDFFGEGEAGLLVGAPYRLSATPWAPGTRSMERAG